MLAAVALGALAGAGIAMLLRPAVQPSPGVRVLRNAKRTAARYRRDAPKRAAELLDRLPLEDIGESLGAHLAAAREAIDDVVAEEIKDLRKAIRRQRKRLGV
ncbi:MAG TPA: hypothetical protein VFW98_10335 [Gemmatimonadaceae bacterium]|nr:hypothetical protein [Gemmatimonadaceae bacterium]